jgi:hypothetical protein
LRSKGARLLQSLMLPGRKRVTPFERVIDALGPRVVRCDGDRATGRRPAHDDRHASLSIGQGDGGKVLLHCHAGCSVEDVCAAIGLRVADLFPADRTIPCPALGDGVQSLGGDRRKAEADALDRVYGVFLGGLSLQATHVADLQKRGLTTDEIMRRGYRSLGRDRLRGVRAVEDRGLAGLLPRCPGFVLRAPEWDPERLRWSIHGTDGILFPVRDASGRIVALKLRRDNPRSGPKYVYLSSKKSGGPSPGSPVHVPLYGGTDTSTVRVTEGELKADVATALSGIRTISIPGVSAWRRAAKVLKELGATSVRVALDADSHRKVAVAEALVALVRQLGEKGFEVELECWSEEAGKGIDDLLAAGKQPEVLKGKAVFDTADGILREALANSPSGPTAEGAERDKPAGAIASLPTINCVDAELSVLTPKAWRALKAANNPPVIFRHGGLPAWIENDDNGSPMLRQLDASRMRYRLARVAHWVVPKKDGSAPGPPPMDVVKDVLATPDMELPILNRIVRAPVFAADGSLAAEPGYHSGARVFYVNEGLEIPPLPERPTAEDVAKASTLILKELLGDFPFVGPADRAGVVALFLLPFVRELVRGPTPLHFIEKPAPGTGASLMVEVLTAPLTGRPAAVLTEGADEEEWRKRITSVLRLGPSVVLIDNLRRRLDSAALSAAITAEVWTDRILGRSEMTQMPVRCAWVVTGNNPTTSTEMARRSVPIRLDAKLDRPWNRDRDGFRHPNLRRWALDHRGVLVWSALVVVRAWIAAGKPPETTASLGGFESWSEVMGGILKVAGIPAFLDNLPMFYERADAESEQWRAFVAAWWTRFGDEPVGVAKLYELVDDAGIDLGKGSDRSQKTRLGNHLKRSRDRRYGDLRLESAGSANGAALWRLVNLGAGSCRFMGATPCAVTAAEPHEPYEPSPRVDARARARVCVCVTLRKMVQEVQEVQEVQRVHLPRHRSTTPALSQGGRGKSGESRSAPQRLPRRRRHRLRAPTTAAWRSGYDPAGGTSPRRPCRWAARTRRRRESLRPTPRPPDDCPPPTARRAQA